MIRVEHLIKNYGPRVAVSDITFEVGQGEVLGFLGPNGAGKTTTMRILTGYLPLSGGRAEVAGFERADFQEHAVGAAQPQIAAAQRGQIGGESALAAPCRAADEQEYPLVPQRVTRRQIEERAALPARGLALLRADA